MTRKDYVLIADAVRESVTAGHSLGFVALHDVAVRLADALRSTNPQFDRGRFLRACGVEG